MPSVGLQPKRLSFTGSTSSFNLRKPFEPTTSISRLLTSALAVAASRSWVLDESIGTKGGLGSLAVAYWAWRIGDEARSKWSDRKGKGKAPPVELSATAIAAAIAEGAETVAFLQVVQSGSPLRAVILHRSALDVAGPNQRIEDVIPSGLSISAILLDQCSFLRPSDHLPTLALLISSYAAQTCAQMASSRPRARRKSNQDTRLMLSVVSAGIAVIILATMGWWDFIRGPLPNMGDFSSMATFLGLCGLLAHYLPLDHMTTRSVGPRPATNTIAGKRDRVVLALAVFAIQFLALHPMPTRLDALIVIPLTALPLLLPIRTSMRQSDRVSSWTSARAHTSIPGRWSLTSILPARWRPHMQTILHTPASSRIFYFLLLNLSYMAVQMAYGVLTNSLGLISDAIHMLFDCLGLAVGLWASVAATWKPDGRYTFGYSRVETLSGFANGSFLILISIFIIFEAIQRVIDPPEMNTNQLLLVSSIGLAINLWGMYATGGHHHHGHNHGHAHSPVPVNEKKVDHRHTNGHSPDHQTSKGISKDMQRHNSFAAARRRSSGPPGFEGHHTSPTHHRRKSSDDHAHRTGDGDRPHSQIHHSIVSGMHDSHAQTQGDEAGHGVYHDHHHDHNGIDDHHHDHNPEHTHRHDPTYRHDHDHEYKHDRNHDDFPGPPHAVIAPAKHDHDHRHDQNHILEHRSISNHTHSLDHHDHDHGHGHIHSHSHAHSHNMRGVFLHVLADTLGSVGVIISTLLIQYTGWSGFDPLASLFIAVLIMASVIPLVVESGRLLCLDVGVDSEKQVREALAELSTVDGLASYASPRFWPRCEGEIVGSIHLHLAPSASNYDPTRQSTPYLNGRSGATIYANAERVTNRVEKILKARISDLTELVVQVEGSQEKRYCFCMTGGNGR